MGKLFEELGLHPVSMLIYLAVLILFVVVFTLLFVKPIRKIVEERKEKLASAFEENRRLNAESVTMKREYEQKLKDIKQETARLSEETVRNAEKRRDEVLAEASIKAKGIVDNAHAEMEAERERLARGYKKDVTELAIGIASTILEREVSEADNKKVINEALEKWSN